MSSSVFDSGNFKAIQTYQTSSHHCAIKGDESQSTRNKGTVQLLITRVLTETKDGIAEEHAEAYESFLSNVEVIDQEYSDLNFGNPFSDSIDQMRSRLLSYKKEKKDETFKSIATGITEFNTGQSYSGETVGRMEKNLEKFVNELIDERLVSCGPIGQRQSFNLAHQIKAIGEHVGSEKILQLADRLELAVLQSHGKYRALMSDL